MNIIHILDTAQIGTALLVIAFLLMYIAFYKNPKKKSHKAS